MKKHIIAALALATVFVSCNRDILTGEVDGFVEDRNVYLQLDYKWGGLAFVKDSAYTLNNNHPIKLKNLRMVFSNFYFEGNDGRIIHNESKADIAISNLDQQLVRVAKLPNGTYSGTIGVTIGFDSIYDFQPPEALPDYNPLKESGMFRGGGNSYNFLELTGSVFLLSQDNTDSIPVLKPFDFKYLVAFSELSIDFTSKKNFSMTANKDVIFVAEVNLQEIFGDVDPSEIFIINCDPGDPVDYNRALSIRDAVEEDVFKFLP